MQRLKDLWFKIPDHTRKPLTLTIGMLFVVVSGLTGWLPGPGGIPLFLIGVTILATEFKWAERIRDTILSHITIIGLWIRHHPVIGPGFIAACIIGSICLLYVLFSN